MDSGVFRETYSDRHVLLREQLLAPNPALQVPPEPALFGQASLSEARGCLLASVRRDGYGLVRFTEPLGDQEFLQFCSSFGTPISEQDASVRPFIRQDVILDLIAAYDDTVDVKLQPFAVSSLALHTESSGSPALRQPRYIVLLCHDPGNASSQARTVLVNMEAVCHRLSEEDLNTLMITRYRRNEAGPSILRPADGRMIFSFRDFRDQDLEWVREGTSSTADEEHVNNSLRNLLAAMYDSPAVGIEWTPGLLLAIDNQRVFHGRTAAVRRSARPRHLRRLRLLQK